MNINKQLLTFVLNKLIFHWLLRCPSAKATAATRTRREGYQKIAWKKMT